MVVSWPVGAKPDAGFLIVGFVLVPKSAWSFSRGVKKPNVQKGFRLGSRVRGRLTGPVLAHLP